MPPPNDVAPVPGSGAEHPGQPAPTAVVTCFVLRQDRRMDEVLVVRRSDRVRTYRGFWAGISGYVEAGVTPLEQAYTELREEAGLTRDDVQMLRSGAALAVHDGETGQDWRVYPFLFEVSDPERIRTDWEASETQWVRPDAVSTLQTVPGLAAALSRVYPPEGQEDADRADEHPG